VATFIKTDGKKIIWIWGQGMTGVWDQLRGATCGEEW